MPTRGEIDKTKRDELIATVMRKAAEIGFIEDWAGLATALNEGGIFTSTGKSWTAANVRIFARRHHIISFELTGDDSKDSEQRVSNNFPVMSASMPPESSRVEQFDKDDSVTGSDTTQAAQEQLITNESPVARELDQEFQNPPRPADKQISPEIAKDLLTNDELALIKKLLNDYQNGRLGHMLEWWNQNQGAFQSTQERRPLFKGKRRNTGLHVNEKILELAIEKVKKDKYWSGGSLSLLVERLLWTYVGEPESLLEIPEPS
jgi:hypothetical protein